MKYNKIIYSVGLSIALISSIILLRCSKVDDTKDNNVKESPVLEFLNSSVPGADYNHRISVWNDQYYDFFTNTYEDKATAIGDLEKPMINDLTISGTPLNYNTAFTFDPMSSSMISSVFGQTVNFSSTGGAIYSAFSRDLYVPDKFQLTFSGVTMNDGPKVTLNSGYTVNWNVDANNPHDIVIVIRTKGSADKIIQVSDGLGSYNITPTDLGGLNPGDLFTMVMGRGNELDEVSNGNTLLIRGASIIYMTGFIGL